MSQHSSWRGAPEASFAADPHVLPTYSCRGAECHHSPSTLEAVWTMLCLRPQLCAPICPNLQPKMPIGTVFGHLRDIVAQTRGLEGSQVGPGGMVQHLKLVLEVHLGAYQEFCC